ncbi:hypothetical protein BDQ17DRAFT_1546611 [Cyathus striatus]|nr:hypothetical protein BDQ17DRAFT_1546611 [Cyathus striatus]
MSHDTTDEIVLPQELHCPTSRRKSQAINNVATIVDNVAGNSVLQAAIQLLEQISDIGRAMPFLTSRIQKKAQDVDTKCNDLLERSTFMLAHIPVLKAIEVNVATLQVIERMIDAMKESAALIIAYRKQGFVARRLHVNNGEKFRLCADSLDVCCKDLMISLQIYQTGKLNCLSRALPVTEQDKHVHAFIAPHNSIDIVTSNGELVDPSVPQQPAINDTVCEQVNASLDDAIQKNLKRLEDVLSLSIESAIIYGFTGLAATAAARESEQRFTIRLLVKDLSLLQDHRSCEVRSHREQHHCDYPYGNFFAYSRSILIFTDTLDVWTCVENVNLETDKIQKASVGKVHWWKTREDLVDQPTILITVGRIWYGSPYFFSTFTGKELRSISATVSLTGNTLVYRTSPCDSEYSMTEWILSSSEDIIGIRLTAKAATSEFPDVRVCHFDTPTCSLSGDVRTISQGGLCAYKPATPYVLPSPVNFSAELSEKPCISSPPLVANAEWAAYGTDNFEGTLVALNKQPDIATIVSASSFYRFIGDEEYSPALSCTMMSPQLPFNIEPRSPCPLKFCIRVLRSQEDKALEVQWHRRAFIARHQPIRIKLVLEDIEGEQCSLVMEYVFNPSKLECKRDEDMAFFYFDSCTTMMRAYISVQKIQTANGFIEFDKAEVSERMLNKLVGVENLISLFYKDKLGSSWKFNFKGILNDIANFWKS